MNHYQKLATLMIRLITFVLLVLGLLGVLYFMFAPQLPAPERGARFVSSIGFTLFGVVGFLFSPLLGRLIGKDL